jgi:orotidine-5'-phosphate decarboxylase
MLDPRERLIVALDVSSVAAAHTIVVAIGDAVSTYKIGMQLFTAAGPAAVREVAGMGKQVFLDLKYHDIPNTVSAAVREAGNLGVSMVTLHGAGGTEMLAAAVNAAQGSSIRLLAATVLTSMDEHDLHETGIEDDLGDQVVRITSLALNSGCAGVVSSAREVRMLRDKFGEQFLAVTPGVRSAGSNHEDQARVVTPAEAISAGASHIVVGRPITGARDPARAAQEILEQIGSASLVG